MGMNERNNYVILRCHNVLMCMCSRPICMCGRFTFWKSSSTKYSHVVSSPVTIVSVFNLNQCTAINFRADNRSVTDTVRGKYVTLRCYATVTIVTLLDAVILGMTLNCIHIFIVTGSFLYWCVMRPARQRFFIHRCIYILIVITSYLAAFLGTNSLSVLMCRKAVNQSINQLDAATNAFIALAHWGYNVL